MREQQTLGRRIQEARKAAGLSQESLGERLGVSRQAVSKWEADAAVPELENLIAMSRIWRHHRRPAGSRAGSGGGPFRKRCPGSPR